MHTTLVIEALSLNYGKAFGFQEYLLNILKYFKEHRKDIFAYRIIIACKYSDKDIFIPFENEMEIKAFNIKSTLHRYYILNTLAKQLKLKSNDIILFTNNYSSLTKHCKHILVIHDLLYLRPQYMPNKAFRIQRNLFVPSSIKIADKIIAISQWVKQDIINHYKIKNETKIIPIYNNFNFRKFNNGNPSNAIKEFCQDKKYFLVVCANAYHKNTISTLQAFVQYIIQGGNKDLVLLGDFNGAILEYYNLLDKNIKKRIFNLHNISNVDLGYLYEHAFAYISATLFEGLGMPIVEAMYFQLPCIVSDIKVVKEVTNNMAVYFSPQNIQELTKQMFEIENFTVPKNQRKIIAEKFSDENTVEKYIQTINGFIS